MSVSTAARGLQRGQGGALTAVPGMVFSGSGDGGLRAYATDDGTLIWSFDTNKGYPCQDHLAALQAWGPSTIHRRSWVFMDNFVPWPSIRRIRRDEPPSLFDAVADDATWPAGAVRPARW